MAITASMVKELRETTGAGMMDCKKALTANDGDMEKAVEFLREKGLAAAAKKASRVAAEGLVMDYVTDDYATGALVEVNSETDFVAKNEEFKSFVAKVVEQASKTTSDNLDDFLAEQWIEDSSKTVKDALVDKISIIGENLNIRRFTKFVAEDGAIVSYIHGEGKIGVLVKLATAKITDEIIEAGKNVAMQIAAINPQYVTRDEVPSDFIEKEKEILKQQALNEGKPEKIVEKMVEGRLTKSLQEICLLDQTYVKDSDLTVNQYLQQVSKQAGTEVTIKAFVRYETGEGIEKKEENFADEVAKQIKG